jgi:cytochrome c oxidase subunit 2
LWDEERVVEENGEKKTVLADREYIVKSIYEPNEQIVEGYQKGLMQSYEDQITQEDIDKIIEYLKALNEQ